MNKNKNFPKIIRIIAGIVSVLMSVVFFWLLFFVESYEFEVKSLFIVFGFVFFGFIALIGTDPISFLQRKHQK